jgi:hypothetical protein
MTNTTVPTASSLGYAANINVRVHDLSDLVLSTRIGQALARGEPGYSLQRIIRVAARESLQTVLERVARQRAWRAYRLNSHDMLLDGDGFFAELLATERSSHCAVSVAVFATTLERFQVVEAALLDAVGASRITDPMFVVHWYFATPSGLDYASMNEIGEEWLLDEAYPSLKEGVASFISHYVTAAEPVLVLQGPPGTGKSRLVRGILAELARRRGAESSAIFTNDPRVLADEQLYVRLLTSSVDAFVLEDADQLLLPRADGNDVVQRFLAIADGIVRIQGRKIIFTTNLPNVGDLDPALVRPGRCFGRVFLRELQLPEAEGLLSRLTKAERAPEAIDRLRRGPRPTRSVAEVYGALVDRGVSYDDLGPATTLRMLQTGS